jgi:hypothetical protein
MNKYAQVLYGMAHWIFTSEESLDQLNQRFAPNMVFVDITNQPQVQEGWSHDGTGFSAPGVPVPTTEEINAPLLAELSALDSSIPRGLEDYWSATAFDVTKLPPTQQQRLAQKTALRAQLVKQDA